MKNCSICKRTVDAENAPILAMGRFGNPRFLCDECASDVESALYGRDAEKIEESMQSLSKKLAASSNDDGLTIETVSDIFAKAGERAKAIKNGVGTEGNECCKSSNHEIPKNFSVLFVKVK